MPQETVFPLSLLVDAWWHLDNGFLHNKDDEERGRDRYPFTEEEGKDIVAGMRAGRRQRIRRNPALRHDTPGNAEEFGDRKEPQKPSIRMVDMYSMNRKRYGRPYN
ncbi:hypothetical protein ABZ897_11870 [Nonomuraea sp. NPDC046802]|uniref:hypothetical protein n=1 Tax=Nonomuraea sp. NPDC046802 TaxID=3154919 RepID=UPI00340AB6D1